MLLNDSDLFAAINANRIKISPPLDLSTGHKHPKSPIQASSLDLHIGEIYFPNVEKDALGGIDNPFTQCMLKPGHTAVVVTREKIKLPNDIAAIGFPPSSVSFKGLLVTNPGHVDPGYHGRMRFAVINMGSDKFPLCQDDKIITLLFFKLAASADAGFGDRHFPGGYIPQPPVTEQNLKCLSADFLQVEERARTVAKDVAEEKMKWPTIIGSVAGALAIIVATLITFGKDLILQQPLEELKSRIVVLEKSADIETLEKRLNELESKVNSQKSIPEQKTTK
jgi:dCTP deaminase